MAASILRLRAAAAAGGYRQFSSSAACLMLPSNKMYRLGEKKVMSIDSSKIEKEFESDKVVGSSHGWVGLMKEEEDRVRGSSSLSLWNPTSGSRMKLPPLDTIKRRPNYYSLRVERLMVDDAECSRAVMAGHFSSCHGGSMNWLGVCCPGRCNEWTLFGHDRGCSYVDAVACSQSRVYSLNTDWELARWNVSDPRRPRREWKKDISELEDDEEEEEEEDFPRSPDHDYLRYTYVHLVYVEQSDQLFLIARHFVDADEDKGEDADNIEDLWKSGIYPNKTVAFDVELLVVNEKGEVEEVRYMENSLNGLVMFVGVNHSFAVAAADFPHLKPDSIYFTDHIDNIPELVDGGHDIGIYDYKNNTISACYYPSLLRSFKGIRPPPFWLTPTSKG